MRFSKIGNCYDFCTRQVFQLKIRDCKMRHFARFQLIGWAISLTGCTCYDAMFNVFGDSYSAGGTSRAEKEYDYNQKIDAATKYAEQNQ